MIEVIVTIVTILGGVVTLLSYFSKEKVRVTICCTESTLLTQKPKIPGITVFVQYEDTIPVENLWRICYTLENTGNRNIIGEGAQSSLVAKGGGLPLYTKNVKKMIQLSATDNNMVELRDICYILNSGCRMSVSQLKLWWKARVRILNYILMNMTSLTLK